MDYMNEVSKSLKENDFHRARVTISQMLRVDGVLINYNKLEKVIKDTDIWEDTDQAEFTMPSDKLEVAETLKDEIAALAFNFSKERLAFIVELAKIVETQQVSRNHSNQATINSTPIYTTEKPARNSRKLLIGAAAIVVVIAGITYYLVNHN